MRSFATILAAVLIATSAAAQSETRYTYTEASDLTLINRLFTDSPNPYVRVDTVRFKGFTKGENGQVRMSTGIAVVFKTNAKSISVLTRYGSIIGRPSDTNGISARGYDLYIRRDGQWLYAASGAPSEKELDKPLTLISNLDGQEHECLMYLPLNSEEYSVKIGVPEGSELKPMANPFRHRVAVFGSSFTQGASTSRSGMLYPAQLERMTGIEFPSLGCCGNSKLQSYFAEALAEVECDAFLFDAFSNPSQAMIRERLFPFIEIIQAKHPGKPLIFQRTIRRESCNFNTRNAASEASRIALTDSLMAVAMKKYKDVYYIYPNATSKDHSASVDGTHPSNYGYTLWAESIKKPVLKILKKYGLD